MAFDSTTNCICCSDSFSSGFLTDSDTTTNTSSSTLNDNCQFCIDATYTDLNPRNYVEGDAKYTLKLFKGMNVADDIFRPRHNEGQADRRGGCCGCASGRGGCGGCRGVCGGRCGGAGRCSCCPYHTQNRLC